MSMLAGKTIVVSATRPIAEARLVRGDSMPSPKTISAAPLILLASRASGNQSGTIDSKKSGFAKCATPADVKSAAARSVDRRGIDPIQAGADQRMRVRATRVRSTTSSPGAPHDHA